MITLVRKYYAACALFLMGICCVSCYKSSDTADDEEKVISETNAGYRAVTFTDLSVTKNEMAEIGHTASSTKETSSLVNHLLVVDLMDGEIVSMIERHDAANQTVLDKPVKLWLKKGKHVLYFVSSENVWHDFDYENQQLIWDAQTQIMKDVWARKLELKVDDQTPESKSIKMDRCVAYVKVIINDAIPADISTFDMEMQGGSWTYRFIEVKQQNPSEISRKVTVPEANKGQTGKAMGIFTFVPDGYDSSASLKVTSRHGNGEAVSSRSFENIPLKVNRYTPLSAEFFN